MNQVHVLYCELLCKHLRKGAWAVYVSELVTDHLGIPVRPEAVADETKLPVVFNLYEAKVLGRYAVGRHKTHIDSFKYSTMRIAI